MALSTLMRDANLAASGSFLDGAATVALISNLSRFSSLWDQRKVLLCFFSSSRSWNRS